MCCVGGGVGQAGWGLEELVALQRCGFCRGLSRDHLCETRAGSDCSHATTRTEAHLADAPIGKLDRQLHNIAADRMLEAHLRVGIGQVADVARMFEVVENNLGVAHRSSSYRTWGSGDRVIGSSGHLKIA